MLNKDSKVIVGGALLGTDGAIKNIETKGTRRFTAAGVLNSYWRQTSSGNDYTNGGINPNYRFDLPSETFDIDTASVEQNVGGHNVSVGTHGSGANAAAINNINDALASVTVFTSDATLIKTGAINTNLPNNSLFVINPNRAGYLIETDPRFTNSRQWLSSEYMMGALGLDPTQMHKRLGDGFYEQKLIREQIAQLTGRRYLDGYSNDDEQYKALMSAGVTAAGQLNLRPGIALSADQMARLTADIVWLVAQEVTLPDGTKTTALVPKIYVAVRPGDIDGSGSLISANSIDLKLSGDLNNSGTISGRNVMKLTANNINNSGRLNADVMSLNAQTDINNVGGLIDATSAAHLKAGRDINVTTTTSSIGNSVNGRTMIDRVAGIYVGDGAAGTTLVLDAGRDVNLKAAQIINDGLGKSVIRAGNDINVGTVQVSESEKSGDARNGSSYSRTTDVGSSIDGLNSVQLQAGNDVNVKGSDINSVLGALVVTAGNDINVSTGKDDESRSSSVTGTKKGFLSKTATSSTSSTSSSTNIASNLTGAQVLIGAGNDVTITGSNVVSDELTWIDAKNKLSITSAVNTETSSHLL